MICRFDVAGSALLRRVGRHLRHLDVSRFASLEYGLRAGLETAILAHCTNLESFSAASRLLSVDWLFRLLARVGAKLKRLTLSDVHL
jgi:hypothetical protein